MDTKEILKAYIEELTNNDPNLKAKLSDERKSWDRMLDYVTGQAKKLAGESGSIAVDDNTVYQWARHYWEDYEPLKEEEPKPAPEPIATVTVKPAPVTKPKKQKEKHYEQLSLI